MKAVMTKRCYSFFDGKVISEGGRPEIIKAPILYGKLYDGNTFVSGMSGVSGMIGDVGVVAGIKVIKPANL